MSTTGANPEAADILRRARERIASPKRWAQCTFARTSYGEGWSVIRDPTACLCINGALALETMNMATTGGASLSLSLVARSRGFETASKFNDAPGRTHAEILAFMDEAIALAESLAQPAS